MRVAGRQDGRLAVGAAVPSGGPPALRVPETLPVAAPAGRAALALPPTSRLPGLPAGFHGWRMHIGSWLALEAERGTLFLFVPVLLAAGALGYFALDAEPSPWIIVVTIAAAATTAWLARDRPVLHRAAVALCLVSGGAGAGQFEAWRAGTTMLAAEVTTRITGRVTAVEHRAGGRMRVTLQVLATERPQLRYAPQTVRLSLRKAPDGLRAGMTLSGLARLQPPSGPAMPGGYDFAFGAYFDGIGGSGFFMGEPAIVASTPAHDLPSRVAIAVEDVRQRIAERIRQRIGGAAGEVAAALMVGVRAGIPPAETDDLRRSGLYHIISISGLHMALVAGTVMAAVRLLGSAWPGAAARWPIKKFAAAAALLASTAYLALSGGEVAAQRSYLMLAIMLLAVLFDRAAVTMRNLALSAIVVILVSPHEVRGPSFQMSFAATAALVAAYGAWTAWRARRARRIPRTLPWQSALVRRAGRSVAALSLASLVAGLATAIYGAYHFHTVSVLGLPANLAATPLVSVVVVPAALVAALTMPFGLDGPFLDLMGLGIRGLLSVAGWIAALAPLERVGTVPPMAVLLLTAALIAATMPTTPLRLAAIPLVLAGLALLASGRTPTMLVSEAGLAGFVASDGRLALSKPAGQRFTIDVWERAMLASGIERPAMTDRRRQGAGNIEPAAMDGSRPAKAKANRAPLRKGAISGSPPPAVPSEPLRDDVAVADEPAPQGRSIANEAPNTLPRAPRGGAAAQERATDGFGCDATACSANAPLLGKVFVTADRERAIAACADATVIVLDAAPGLNRCARPEVVVVNRRDLARRGSVAIFEDASGRPDVIHAIETLERPWTRHRAYSRAARDLESRGDRRPVAADAPTAFGDQ